MHLLLESAIFIFHYGFQFYQGVFLPDTYRDHHSGLLAGYAPLKKTESPVVSRKGGHFLYTHHHHNNIDWYTRSIKRLYHVPQYARSLI